MNTTRRHFLARGGTLAAGAATLAAGCNPKSATDNTAAVRADKTYEWKMLTSWPPDFPGLGTGANRLAEMIGVMSNGRMRIKVYGGNELVPPLEVFDAVSAGTAEMGHAAAYYWKGKAPAAQFFGAVPFGMTADEVNGWLYYGGGLALWQELYAPFNLTVFPAGNTGVQMGGWFNKEIFSIEDLKGLRMRIPGLGGEALRRAGGTPVELPGAELFTALQTGTIDATEWVGPYNDLAFGLYRAARYYYYPGWHEPGPTLELTVNRDAWDDLNDDLKAIVETAARAVNLDMYAEYTARNQSALTQLVEQHQVKLRRFPNDVLAALKRASEAVLNDLAASDPMSAKVYESYADFKKAVTAYTGITEEAYLAARKLPPRA